MATVIEDLGDGATASVGQDGFSATRIFLVTDIDGSAAAKTGLALTASGIPRRGEAHPAIAGIYADTITATMVKDGTSTVRVEVSYKKFDGAGSQEPSETQPGILTIGATLVQVETNKDVEGKAIEVAYLPKDSTNPLADVRFGFGPITVDESCVIFTLSRREPGGTIGAKVVRFVNTVNREGNFGGYPARTWKCTRIATSTNDGGDSYEVNYEFQYRRQTWDAILGYVDRETGEVPEDLNDPPGNGVKAFQVYLEEDFDELGLFRNG